MWNSSGHEGRRLSRSGRWIGPVFVLILPIVMVLSSSVPWVGAAHESRASVGPHPFQPGERLTYTVSWMGINSGTAVLEVKDLRQVGHREIYHIVSTAQSNDFISLFYPVDDRVESLLDVEGLYSHNIKVRQHEGRKRRNKTVIFDQVNHRALQIKNNRQEIFDIPPNVNDSLSSLYFFRTMDGIEVGSSVFIDVHESEKNWKLEIKALRKERVSVPVGTFDTVKLQAKVRYEGIFMDKGDVFLWVTDDRRKVPVMMKGKIKIGSVTAVLISRRERLDPSSVEGEAVAKF